MPMYVVPLLSVDAWKAPQRTQVEGESSQTRSVGIGRSPILEKCDPIRASDSVHVHVEILRVVLYISAQFE